MLSHIKRDKAVLQWLIKMVKPNPHQSELVNLLQHYQNKRYEDAEKLALNLTEKFPNHPFGWKVLGALLNQINRSVSYTHLTLPTKRRV